MLKWFPREDLIDTLDRATLLQVIFHRKSNPNFPGGMGEGGFTMGKKNTKKLKRKRYFCKNVISEWMSTNIWISLFTESYCLLCRFTWDGNISLQNNLEEDSWWNLPHIWHSKSSSTWTCLSNWTTHTGRLERLFIQSKLARDTCWRLMSLVIKKRSQGLRQHKHGQNCDFYLFAASVTTANTSWIWS